MSKQLKKIPHFKSEKDESRFWQVADSTDYVDYSQLKSARFPNLKLSSRPVTMRLPETLIDRLKLRANRVGIPYQALIRQMLFRGLKE